MPLRIIKRIRKIIRRILRMPNPETGSTWTPETEYTWRDSTSQSGAGFSFTSGGSFVYDHLINNSIEYEWVDQQEEHFQEYIDEDCECPTKRRMDGATAELARLIYNYLVTSNQMDMGEHKDMIFESAQRIIRAITP